MTRAAILAAALCTAGIARADAPTAVVVEVGKAIDVCKAKLVTCPVRTVMCEASAVARLVNGANGVDLKGVAPGTTRCSATALEGGAKRVLEVTVKAAPKPGKPTG